jgi:5-methylcytosine-specific restriction endonuclease McrA
MQKCKNCQAVLPDKPEGKMGRNQIFCNEYCGKLFRGEVKLIDKPIACLWCNAVLDQSKTHNPKKFCSRKHAADFRQANKPKVLFIEYICNFCSSQFFSNRKQPRFCSQDCRRNQYSVDKKIKYKNREPLDPRRFDFDCNRCGQLVITDVFITKGKYGRFCRPCALVKRREAYRVKTAKRQGVAKPARLSADALIERDGSLCRLCNTEIDLNLARNSRWGATIDHVIPLSLGGSDDIENMQLAHWICNIKKGNRV